MKDNRHFLQCGSLAYAYIVAEQKITKTPITTNSDRRLTVKPPCVLTYVMCICYYSIYECKIRER